MLNEVDEHVAATSLRALAGLSEGSIERVRAFVDTEGLIDRVVEMLRAVMSTAAGGEEVRARAAASSGATQHIVTTASLAIIRNLCTANSLSVPCADSCVQAVLDADVLPLLLQLLYHDSLHVRAVTASVIANILAGSNAQINAVLCVDQTSGFIPIGRFIPKLFDLLEHDPEPEPQQLQSEAEAELWFLRLECAYALSNFCDAGYLARCTLLDEEGISAVGAALLLAAETATALELPVLPARLPGTEALELALETLAPLLATVEGMLQGKNDRDEVERKITQRKRPKSAARLTVAGVAVGLDAEVPPWVAQARRDQELALMAPMINGCKQLLLLPGDSEVRDSAVGLLLGRFGCTPAGLAEEEARLRAPPQEERVVPELDPDLTVADKLTCCRCHEDAPEDEFSALRVSGKTLKHTFREMYIYVAEKSDLNTRDECIWCEPRLGQSGDAEGPLALGDEPGKTIGRLTYRRVLNPRTGITNEQWDNYKGAALIAGVLRVLEVEYNEERWEDVCRALAVPKLTLCYADAANEGTKVKQTRPAPKMVMAALDTTVDSIPGRELGRNGRPETAGSRRMRLASRASGMSGGIATHTPKLDVSDTNHVSNRLTAVRDSANPDYGDLMRNLEMHFS